MLLLLHITIWEGKKFEEEKQSQKENKFALSDSYLMPINIEKIGKNRKLHVHQYFVIVYCAFPDVVYI